MSSLELWLYSYPAHLHWEQTEPGEFLWGDVTTYACCRESIKKAGPAEQHGICKEHSSGKGGLTLALKGQNWWICRFFSLPFLGQLHFRAGSVISVYRCGVLEWQQNYTWGSQHEGIFCIGSGQEKKKTCSYILGLFWFYYHFAIEYLW